MKKAGSYVKKMMLIVLLIALFAGSLFANGDENKIVQNIKWLKSMRESILSNIDSLIVKGSPIAFEENEPDSKMQIMRGDVKEVEFYYKLMCYGTKLTQLVAITQITKWWYDSQGGLDPGSIEILKTYNQYTFIESDTIFLNHYKPLVIKKMYEFLDSDTPMLEVAAAQALLKLNITDSIVVNKLKYYADKKNLGYWENKIDMKLYGNTKNKKDAINILLRGVENILNDIKAIKKKKR